jgi:hypothetical protein
MQQIITGDKTGAPLWTCKKMSKHSVETHIITCNQEIQNCAFCQQSDVDAVSGL